MKAILLSLLLASSAVAADRYVDGYVRKDGTYVQPHYQTAPNNSKYDNYSSQGNTNPYTGQRGHERNEYSTEPTYNQPRSNADTEKSYTRNR